MSDMVTRKVKVTANTEKHGKVQGNCTLTIDFSDVTRDELIEMARKSLTIDWQQKVRKAAEKEGRKALERFDDDHFSVRDYLDNKPQRKDSATKAAEQLAKLSPEERAAILAEFGATQE